MRCVDIANLNINPNRNKRRQEKQKNDTKNSIVLIQILLMVSNVHGSIKPIANCNPQRMYTVIIVLLSR